MSEKTWDDVYDDEEDLTDFYEDDTYEYDDDAPDWAYLQAEAEDEYEKYDDDLYDEIDPWFIDDEGDTV